jgi:hypothetical protein
VIGCREHTDLNLETARRSLVLLVVLVGDGVEQCLQRGDRGGLLRLGAEPLLQGLLEPFDLAAGGGVAGAGVLLGDREPA